MKDRDPLADALTALEAPPLDPHFAARVGARAKAELRAPPRASPDVTRLRLAVAGGLVPTLLVLAALVGTADAASTIVQIYGKGSDASLQ